MSHSQLGLQQIIPLIARASLMAVISMTVLHGPRSSTLSERGRDMLSRRSPDAMIITALYKEIEAIHLANSLYWKQGAAVTVAARKEYQRRQDRLEEIRLALFIISVRQQYRDEKSLNSHRATELYPVPPRTNSDKAVNPKITAS
jgi:hypothetical protein